MARKSQTEGLDAAVPTAGPWMANARGPEDGPPYEVWHTGGPGGPIGQFDQYEDAVLAACAPDLLAQVDYLTELNALGLKEADLLSAERDEARAELQRWQREFGPLCMDGNCGGCSRCLLMQITHVESLADAELTRLRVIEAAARNACKHVDYDPESNEPPPSIAVAAVGLAVLAALKGGEP